MKKILVVDNNDSFVYNLVEYLRRSGLCEVDVVRTAHLKLDLVDTYDGILLSPGAGLPDDYPLMMDLLAMYYDKKAILGVCLGHQAIASFFGSPLIQLPNPKHGHASKLLKLRENVLLSGLNDEISVGRYHSWTVDKFNIPSSLIIDALDEDGNVMMLSHVDYPIVGVQFHPESIITTEGELMIQNWVKSI